MDYQVQSDKTIQAKQALPPPLQAQQMPVPPWQ